MATAASGANVLLGKGKLYFDRFDSDGDPTGERFLGNCTKIEMKPATEVKEKYDSTTSGAPLLKQAVIRENLEISITMDEFTRENIALVLMGSESTYAQSSDAVTDEPILSAVVDRFIRLANRKLTAITNVKKAPSTTYTATTDYVPDLVNGRLYIPTGSAIGALASGTALTCSYTKPAIVGDDKVMAATVGAIEGFLRFMADPSAGPVWDAEFWKVSFTPSGVLSLIGEDFGAMDLAGKVLADATNHQAEPYGRLIKRT